MDENWLKPKGEMTIGSNQGRPMLLVCRRFKVRPDTTGCLLRSSCPDGAPFIIMAPNSDTINKQAISKLIGKMQGDVVAPVAQRFPSPAGNSLDEMSHGTPPQE